jgi:hypothetical protein
MNKNMEKHLFHSVPTEMAVERGTLPDKLFQLVDFAILTLENVSIERKEIIPSAIWLPIF